MMESLQNIKQFALVGLMAFLFASCGFDKYNAVTADTEDLREGDTRVYGDSPDAPPRQAALEYPQPEDGAKRAADIKKKWLGLEEEAPATDSTTTMTAPAADSTQVDSTTAATE